MRKRKSKKFAPVEEVHIRQAAEHILSREIKDKYAYYNRSEYFVVIENEPYPVKELVRTAFDYTGRECPSFFIREACRYMSRNFSFEIYYRPQNKPEQRNKYFYLKGYKSKKLNARIENKIRINSGERIESIADSRPNVILEFLKKFFL